jgi:hypothetical protein
MLLLADHTWSYAGNDKREDISATYLQPVLAHSSKKGFTVALSSESTYNWKAKNRKWMVPLIGSVSQILPLGKHYISVGLGGIYYAKAPSSAPEWGIRFTLTFLFPHGSQQSEKANK